jgi:hypothetical protein
MHVTIGPLTPMEFFPLMPTPSVRENEALPVGTSDACLHDGPILVIGTYRGHIMHLDNGASVYRDSPKTGGGNGYLYNPIEAESCIVRWRGGTFRAIVDFHSNVEPQATQAQPSG